MSLEDALNDVATASLPYSERPHVTITGNTGESVTGLTETTLISDDESLLRYSGLDPEEWEVVSRDNIMWLKEKQYANKRSIKFTFRRRTQYTRELHDWLTTVFTPPAPHVDEMTATGDPIVICLADMQIGKAQERLGGTPELINRFHNILGQLTDYVAAEEPRHLVIADLGDICENTSNHTSVSQVSTNDITFAEQLQVAQRLLGEAIEALAPYAGHTTIVGVDSNHMQERLANGQQNAHGDFGVQNILMLKNFYDRLDQDGMLGLNLEWEVPGPLDSGVFLTVEGLPLAFTHGHDAGSPNKMAQWLANQAALPGSPYATARVLIHGHFHHFQSTITRHRRILGVPALESGSGWVKRRNGEESDPGVVTFRIHNKKYSSERTFEEL